MGVDVAWVTRRWESAFSGGTGSLEPRDVELFEIARDAKRGLHVEVPVEVEREQRVGPDAFADCLDDVDFVLDGGVREPAGRGVCVASGDVEVELECIEAIVDDRLGCVRIRFGFRTPRTICRTPL